MIHLQSLKLANAIKCGPSEESFLTASKFAMALEDNGITIRCEHLVTRQVTHTTLFNTIYFIEATEPEERPAKGKQEPAKGKGQRQEVVL